MALNAPDWLVARPIAHRGLHDLSAGFVENTLAAANAALDAGFAIECDLQLSADGEVFVFHDDVLDRLTEKSGRLIEKSAAEIRAVHLAAAPETIPAFSDLLALVAGGTPIVCELKSRFDGDWRIGERAVVIADDYAGPLAFKSFDPDLIAYIRLRFPHLRRPLGVVAEASYEAADWDFLSDDQRRACQTFNHRGRSAPDFLSWRVGDLPHGTPFFEKELHGLPIMTWTVKSDADRSAARKWADQIIFEGEGRP